MLSLLLIPALAFQTPAPATTLVDCANAHEEMAKLTRGASVVTEDADQDERITRTPLTTTAPLLAYLTQPASIVHVERYSYDTEGYRDTIEITLNQIMLVTKGSFRVAHKLDCLPSSGRDDCLLPDLRTSGNPIIVSARKQGAQVVVSCTKVRER